MALTYGTAALSSPKVYQANFIIRTTVTFDSSYPTGGEDISDVLDADFENTYTIIHLEALNISEADVRLVYNPSTGKLQAYVVSTGAEVADTTDLSGIVAAPVIIWAE